MPIISTANISSVALLACLSLDIRSDPRSCQDGKSWSNSRRQNGFSRALVSTTTQRSLFSLFLPVAAARTSICRALRPIPTCNSRSRSRRRSRLALLPAAVAAPEVAGKLAEADQRTASAARLIRRFAALTQKTLARTVRANRQRRKHLAVRVHLRAKIVAAHARIR